MDLVAEKIRQAQVLLAESGIDLWMIFVRETPVLADPAMDMVVGADATWPSCFLYTSRGDAVALVGRLDKALFSKPNRFTEIVTYDEDVSVGLRELLTRFDPGRIAINYSINNPAADGLTHGMYLSLKKKLRGTPYAKRLVSSESLVTKLRARKLPSEIDRLSQAAELAARAWEAATQEMATGVTEREVAIIIDGQITRLGGANSFPTIVNAGDKTEPGHGQPTEAKLAGGDLLHVDFGARVDGYCSDLQRLLYFSPRGKRSGPNELEQAFETVRDVISQSARLCRPGMRGYQIDRQARATLHDLGYPEFQHALGHQLGRSVHDGGAIIGPKWAKYGISPTIPLELNNVFTLELEISLPGIGCVGLEEDICVTESGGRFICPRQMELIIK